MLFEGDTSIGKIQLLFFKDESFGIEVRYHDVKFSDEYIKDIANLFFINDIEIYYCSLDSIKFKKKKLINFILIIDLLKNEFIKNCLQYIFG